MLLIAGLSSHSEKARSAEPLAREAEGRAKRDEFLAPVRKPSVLLVTGAYHPEISSGGIQCRAVARALASRAKFTVLTTAVDGSLPERASVDDVPVHRVIIDVTRWSSRLRAAIRLLAIVARLRRDFAIVHLHGFSQKNILLTALARLLRKRLVLTLHTAGYDDPDTIRTRGRLAFWSYTRPDLFISVSPRLSARYVASGLPAGKLQQIPNGVDTGRFRPADQGERLQLRRELGLPAEDPVILFVGFFSREKRPDLLFEAWTRLLAEPEAPRPLLVYVGAMRSPYHEVDEQLADTMRAEAQRLGVGDRLAFVEPVQEIEKYFRTADVFALPSSREALPLALLEAMATGLPCVASRLSGATDVLIEDRANGVLVPADDAAGLAGALRWLLADPRRARALGIRARETVRERYSIDQTADGWLRAYQELLAR